MNASADITYEDFELIVGSRQNGFYPISVAYSPSGEIPTIYCPLDPSHHRMIAALQLLASGEADPQSVEEFGEALFDGLFNDQLAKLYRTSLQAVRDQGKKLRLRLRIDAPEFARLPWEYLRDAEEAEFLALSGQASITRSMSVPRKRPLTIVQPPLRVLAVFSEPNDLPPLDIAVEAGIIEEALSELVDSKSVELHVVQHATVEKLQDNIRRLQPHIFHFVGHGLVDADRAYLAFEDEKGEVRPVDEFMVREFFANSKETRVVVLNACQTASISSIQAISGLAPRLLQRNLSAVVAMQFPISDAAALRFSQEFYGSLAQGYTLDDALNEARKGIWDLGKDSIEWATPVLYLRANDGNIFVVDDVKLPQPVLESPPRVVDFLGRATELAHYRQILQDSGFAIIHGMPGVGKTSLAAKVAEQSARPAQVFWHTCYRRDGVEKLIWDLAGFLHMHGKDAIWRSLNAAQSGGQLPPPGVLMDRVFEHLRNSQLLICLDDFQEIEGDPLAPQLLDRLRISVTAKDFRLLVTSQSVVNIDLADSTAPLAGLNPADCEALLRSKNLMLDSDLLNQLYIAVEGNAELLTLTIPLLNSVSEPDRVIVRLAESKGIEDYVVKEIDDHLDDVEKEVMSGVAALIGYPGTRYAIEEVLDRSGLKRTLMFLSNRNLLLTQEGDWDRQYREHAIVQAFYYDLLSRRERRAMHSRAAVYYEFEEVDDLRSAIHYFHAGETNRATEVCTRDLDVQINQGRAQPVLTLLDQIPEEELDADKKMIVWEAKGILRQFLGDLEGAENQYRMFLDHADGIAAAMVSQVLARLCRAKVTVGDYSEALEYIDAAIKKIDGQDAADWERENLAVSRGEVLFFLGRYEEAQDVVTAYRNRLDNDPDASLVARVHDLMGRISFATGKIPDTINEFEAALAIRQQQGDPQEILRAYSNLAVAYQEQQRFEDAVAANRTALAMANQIGHVTAAVQIESNLAINYLSMGDLPRAAQLMLETLGRYERLSAVSGLCHSHNNLAYVYLQMGQIDGAMAHIEMAKAYAERMEEPAAKSATATTFAQIQLASGHPNEALAACLEAQHLATESGNRERWAEIHATLGAVYSALSRPDEARLAYAEAIEAGRASGAWPEVARIYLEWIRMEKEHGDIVQAQTVCNASTELLGHGQHGLEEELELLCLSLLRSE